jgi:chaperonin GroEL
MNKTVLFGDDARDKVIEGVRKIAKAVSATLGPKGRNVLISRGAMDGNYNFQKLPLHVTKDGVTVARAFGVSDPVENIGVMLIKEAAQKTVDIAGDSTTTTVVLAAAMIESGHEYMDQADADRAVNPIEVKKGMDDTAEKVVAALKKMAVPVAGDVQRVKQVATISANNDEAVGAIIAKAYEVVGDDGLIKMEPSKSSETKVRITDGFKFERGLISPYLINDAAKMICEYPNMRTDNMPNEPFILLYDRPITMFSQIQPILTLVQKQQRPLLIVAEDVDAEALAVLVTNKHNGRIAVTAVKAPFFAEQRDEAMEDIAVLTGGTYLSQLKGIKLENATLDHLGLAGKVVVTKNDTTIIGGHANKTVRDLHLEKLREQKKESVEGQERDRIEQRIARLQSAIAVIEVGAATETEVMEKMDRFDDAIRSVKAAIAEGFVPGGGTAFIKCKPTVSDPSDDVSADYRKGEEIVLWALPEVLLTICENAGTSPAQIIKSVEAADENFGYNAIEDRVENLVDAGVIDAVKVLTTALTNATSVAGMLITSECLIVDSI